MQLSPEGNGVKRGGENIHIKRSNLRPHSLTQRENEEVHSNYHGRGASVPLCRVRFTAAKLARVDAVDLFSFIQGDFRSQPT